MRESVSGVERDAGRRQRRNEVDERRLEVRTRGGLADGSAVVVPSERDEWPAVVASGFDDVDLVTAKRSVLCFPDGPGRRMNRQPLRAAVTERVDLRHVTGAAHKRVVCRHAAIVLESERLAAVIAGVLRAVLLLALADGEKEEAVAIKGDAPAEVGF